MKRSFLFHHLLLFACFCSLAQVPEIIPPSPNAASLGQYGEVPVNYHTGVPNISIPLYTIVSDDIEVPISLSFHASGHKVGTTASWVGLGWSLNAGGAVTRSVRGRPDESGFFYNMERIQEWQNSDLMKTLQNSFDYTGQDSIVDFKEDMRYITDRNEDTESDLYFYSMPAMSGKFIYHENESIIPFPHQDLRIESNLFAVENFFNTGFISSFEITTTNGVKYTFQDVETSTTTRAYGIDSTDPDVYNSAWNLSSINGVGGATVNFHYSMEPLTQDMIQGRSHSYSAVVLFEPNMPDGVIRSEWPDEIISTYSHQTSMTPQYLDSITWKGGKAEFYRSEVRNDLPQGGQRLDSIAIFDYTGSLVKKYLLSYEDFTPADPQTQHLELLSVQEVGTDGTNKNPYTFEYHAGVPDRDSKAVDHLGFYNAKLSNTTIIPTYTTPLGVVKVNADKNPGNGVSKVGMIRKINYPLGGSSEFIYEAHDYSHLGIKDFQVDSIFGRDSLYVPEDQWVEVNLGTVTAEKCDSNGVLFGLTLGVTCDELDEVTFTVPDDTTGNSISVVNFHVLYDSAAVLDPQNYYVEIYRVDTVSGNNTLVRAFSAAENLTVYNVFTPGETYYAKAVSNVQGARITAYMKYYYAPRIIYTGGIRIAEVINEDGSGEVRRRKFNYRLSSDSKKSSGVYLANYPDYEHTMYEEVEIGLLQIVQNVSAHPNGFLGYLSESHVIYTEVEVVEEGNGSTRYFYSMDFDEKYETEWVSNFWKRGHLLKTEVYNESKVMLRKDRNYYSFRPVNDTHSLTSQFLFKRAAVTESRFDVYEYKLNSDISGWARLDRTEVTSYELDKLVESSTDYEYDSMSLLLLPRHIIQNKGTPEEVKETISYLDDRVNHVISPMINKVTYANGTHVNREQHLYSVDHKLTRIEHTDSQGNVKRYQDLAEHNGIKPSLVTQHTGIEQYVLWGYDGDLPVAVISPKPPLSQATIDAIAQHTFTGTVATDVNYLKTQLDTYMSNPNYEVQLFTHKPLIGITSQTDTNGKTTYYRYDAYGRLEAVLDQDQNFLKKYTYTEKAN